MNVAFRCGALMQDTTYSKKKKKKHSHSTTQSVPDNHSNQWLSQLRDGVNYYLQNIPMKGKTTFFGAKRSIRLWNDSSDDVW
jgi:hypothetical protein